MPYDLWKIWLQRELHLALPLEMTIPMHSLDDREAFLLTIFAAPDDDLPRLVYADWLDEHDEPLTAEFIRLDVELFDRARNLIPELPQQTLRYDELLPLVYPEVALSISTIRLTERGFPHIEQDIVVRAEELADAEALRRVAITECPDWYRETHLKVPTGLIDSAKQIQTLLTSPVFQQVVHLDLSGDLVHVQSGPASSNNDDNFALGMGFIDYEYRPVITVQAVEALVNAREARRFITIDLRNNDLDNDAARAIIRSKNLIRLKQLYLLDGNQLRGRTWAQLQERFEGGVVQ